MQGTGKVDWQEVFSDGTDPEALAGTREEVEKIDVVLPSFKNKPAAKIILSGGQSRARSGSSNSLAKSD